MFAIQLLDIRAQINNPALIDAEYGHQLQKLHAPIIGRVVEVESGRVVWSSDDNPPRDLSKDPAFTTAPEEEWVDRFADRLLKIKAAEDRDEVMAMAQVLYPSHRHLWPEDVAWDKSGVPRPVIAQLVRLSRSTRSGRQMAGSRAAAAATTLDFPSGGVGRLTPYAVTT